MQLIWHTLVYVYIVLSRLPQGAAGGDGAGESGEPLQSAVPPLLHYCCAPLHAVGLQCALGVHLQLDRTFSVLSSVQL